MKAHRVLTAIALAMAVLAHLVPEPAHAGTSISIQIGDDDAPQPMKKNGPPDHAPAHGYRAKHQYHYYPAQEVYFDTGARMYFYFSGGDWKMAATLPLNLKAALGDRVSIEMDSDRPYTEHSKHKKQYPPGQAKNHAKAEKHNKGGNGKGKDK